MLFMKKKKIIKNKSSGNKILKIFMWGIVALLALIGFIELGYYIGYVDGSKYIEPQKPASKEPAKKEHFTKTSEQNISSIKEPEHKDLSANESKRSPILPPMEETAQNSSSKREEDLKERLKTVLKEEQNRYAQKGAAHEHEEPIQKLDKPIKIAQEEPPKLDHTPKKVEKTPKKEDSSSKKNGYLGVHEKIQKEQTNAKPKLAIIIDDVSFTQEVNSIKKLNLNLTMSFLPPNIIHPDSALLASKESFYMVHLPMEAINFNACEPLTLKVEDSQAVISKRVDDVVKFFPRVRYLNNHTGSKFTSDEAAMNKLIFALKEHKIEFIDSRTIAGTKAQKVMKAYGERYIARDVFLDDIISVPYVKQQIKEAVELAKKRGYAVAIGHPHVNTLEALRESKALLSEVELVQINKI